MELTRVIHPIGQGGFYTETLKDDDGKEVFNVVYDCGSETGKPYDINSYLEKYYPDSTKHPKKQIDAVFISHLHNDHINGLVWLLGNTNVNVKYLFLPQLTEEIILESLLYNACLNKGSWNSTNDLILNLYASGNDTNWIGETRIIKIDSENNDNNESKVIDFADLKQEGGHYSSGTVFKYGHWLYIPINSQPNISKKNNVCFYDFFKQQVNNGLDFSLTEIKGIFNGDPQKCIDAYTTYFSKKHNSYSMTLFSGTDKRHIFNMCRKSNMCRCCHHCEEFTFHNHFPANFLFTGDFEPNETNLQILKNTLKNKTRIPLWNTMSGIQVPHHGSRNNFNCELYVNPCVGYISAGSRNRHKHPNVDTLVNIHKEGCWPIVVSEDPSSMQIEVYRF